MLASALMVGFLASCSAGLPTTRTAVKTGFKVRKEVVYSPDGWPQTMKGDLYQPDVEQPAPGVLLIHGGGWSGGDKRWQMSAIARRLAKHGFVVFNVTYRTTPDWQHPAQYEDLVQALKWMRAHAQDLNLDSDRLATFGYSAGGHLAELVGFQAEKEGVPVQAIVAGGAPSDLMITDSPLVEALLGGSREEMPARYREASPVTFVTSESPPVFLYHAAKDSLVWPRHSRELQEKLAEKGVEHQLVWTLGKGHISGFLFPGTAITEAIAFLDRQIRTSQ